MKEHAWADGDGRGAVVNVDYFAPNRAEIVAAVRALDHPIPTS